MNVKYLICCLVLIGISGCSTNSKIAEKRRQVIDNTYHGENLPEWTRDGKSSWDDGKNVVFKAEHTIRGDQRVNACFDLAKMDLKENVVTEISANIKGEINLASEGISEASETALTKSFTQQIEVNISGLKHKEQLFERYLNGDTERVDCFVMATMTHHDYEMLKTNVLQKAARSNSELAEILRKRQSEFFVKNLPAQASISSPAVENIKPDKILTSEPTE